VSPLNSLSHATLQAALELEPSGQLEVSVGFERVAVDTNTGKDEGGGFPFTSSALQPDAAQRDGSQCLLLIN
jgi:hypothetical protein